MIIGTVNAITFQIINIFLPSKPQRTENQVTVRALQMSTTNVNVKRVGFFINFNESVFCSLFRAHSGTWIYWTSSNLPGTSSKLLLLASSLVIVSPGLTMVGDIEVSRCTLCNSPVQPRVQPVWCGTVAVNPRLLGTTLTAFRNSCCQ